MQEQPVPQPAQPASQPAQPAATQPAQPASPVSVPQPAQPAAPQQAMPQPVAQSASPQPTAQQAYAQPVAQPAPQNPYASAGSFQAPYGYAQSAAFVPQPPYAVSEQDRTLRLIAFIFSLISLVTLGWLIVPLAWMIPMCVVSWGIYKGTRPNTVAFGVCTLIFVSLVAGILLLISRKDR